MKYKRPICDGLLVCSTKFKTKIKSDLLTIVEKKNRIKIKINLKFTILYSKAVLLTEMSFNIMQKQIFC